MNLGKRKNNSKGENVSSRDCSGLKPGSKLRGLQRCWAPAVSHAELAGGCPSSFLEDVWQKPV